MGGCGDSVEKYGYDSIGETVMERDKIYMHFKPALL